MNTSIERQVKKQRGGRKFPEKARGLVEDKPSIFKSCRDGKHTRCFVLDCQCPCHGKREGVKTAQNKLPTRRII